ncbi:MAG: D-glycero-beta-D-manno-heptose 1-phosphate adenylyltransferase [Chitinophagaceae bacterium]|nr:D-glycero-beta-D-manno-heptose 1-phosphate adenylyltransferase [Chitinophagaceae bacterium]MBL0334281.1 D-glycero-beta-D-manno-heptose 1-phosphate adenylyltransferase [Chitinophagaceae bacterium]
MKRADLIPTRILTRPELVQRAAQWRMKGYTIAFTNGVFDILHPGHIFSLSAAAKEADYLVVGLNADASVKRLKGDSRPVNNQDARSILLSALVMVDAVVLFEEDTPLELIKALMPDVLVKGGDYTIDQVVGAKEVIENGGKVIINPILEGFSTTAIIEKSRGNS